MTTLPGLQSRPAWPCALALSLAFALPAQPLRAQDTEAAIPLAERDTLAKGSVFRVLGQEVKGVTGIVVGQVVNVLVDDTGQPRAAVLDYGGFLGVGRRRIAVAWPTLRFTAEGIHLSLSRDNLRNFPEYKEGEAIQMALPPAHQPSAPSEAANPAAPGTAPNPAETPQPPAPPATPPGQPGPEAAPATPPAAPAPAAPSDGQATPAPTLASPAPGGPQAAPETGKTE